MSQFVQTEPLQACKLAAIVGVLLFGVAGAFRLIPGHGLSALLLVIVFSLGLALVVAAEALLAGYRAIRTDELLAHTLTDRPVYTAIRAVEVVIAVLAASAFVVTFVTVTGKPMAGPGAIGLMFFGVALGLLILGASLVRTLSEYYYHRRADGA